ncbi:MAG: phospholipase D [Elusimicrobia bacterium]|nr:MAG: phospholipase D [Elusimicrobiota bacterium]
MNLPYILLAAVLTALPARAAGGLPPDFELVQTAPAETDLAEPGLRSAADVWVELFDRAGKYIDIEQFYVTLKDGEPTDAVMAALKRAGERGVRIRFLIEKKFEKNSAESLPALRAIPNLELRVLEFSKVKDDGIIHAKFIVVDGREAYVGSQNFDWRALKHIHEMGLRTTEPSAAAGAAAVFEHDWTAAGLLAEGKPVAPLRSEPVAASTSSRAVLVASPWAFNPDGVGDSALELTRLIGSAETELEIQLLDYAPLTRKKRFYPPIDGALREAAARGVAVRLLVSHWNTAKPYVDWLKSLDLVPGVEVRVITVPEAKEGFIPFARVAHSKYMVVDGKTLWLGTSNWTGGYLDNSRNLELVVREAALAAQARAVHKRLWGSAYTAPLDILKDYPPFKKG